MTNPWNNRLFMTREQMREYDRIAIEEVGIPGPVLMENAGRGAAQIARRMLDGGRNVAVLAGPGNNGGDGFVIARHLLNSGIAVTTHLAVDAEKISGDARTNLDILRAMGGEIVNVASESSMENLASDLSGAGLVVDALLGTGVSRTVEGHLARVIEVVNGAKITTLAVDLPSGLDCNTGSQWGSAINADATVTFGHIKRGLLLHPGTLLAGELHVVPIGAPALVSEKAGYDGTVLSEDSVKTLLPERGPNAHKGSFGHLRFMAGSLGKTGAAALGGQAAMRVGTGLVTIATTANAQPVIEARCMEVMVKSLLEKVDAPLTEKVVNKAKKLLEGKAAVALGPGLTTAPGVSALTMRILQMMEVPAVVDADGLNILARDPSGAGRISAPMVFTPHPGEMARLTNKPVAAIQADRIGITREAARWHKVVLVLKGANTVIASPDGRVFVNPTGNPGMASGGMGDVLTGIIGGMLAQGLSPLEAALLGTYLHGHCADIAAKETGAASLVASDLIVHLPAILRDWAR